MDITVTFRHMEPTESLKTYAEEKISKIDKILDSPSEAHIVLEVEKFRHIADVTFSVNGTRIKAVEETGDMYSAIDQVMDKIETQVKRHRSKIRKRTPGNIKGEEMLVTEENEAATKLTVEEPSIEIEKLVFPRTGAPRPSFRRRQTATRRRRHRHPCRRSARSSP